MKQTTNVLPNSIQNRSMEGLPFRRRVFWLNFHRKVGLVILIPIILWCFSGLMHPIMSRWVKVSIPKRSIDKVALSGDEFSLSLQEILKINQIQHLVSFNVVNIEGAFFYQVILPGQVIKYFNVDKGNELPNGDEIYAKYLARFFMQEEEARVSSLTIVNKFTDEYRFINRLLPVYKIHFDRDDGLDVYIHTKSSRLGGANDNLRKSFQWVFKSFHNWGLFDFLGYWKTVIMSGFLLLIFFSAASGLYVYIVLWKRFKKQMTYRAWHRRVGIGISLAAFAFSFSGVFHLLHKNDPYELDLLADNQLIERQDLSISPKDLVKKMGKEVNELTLISIKKEPFYRLSGSGQKGKDVVSYVSAVSGDLLIDGDEKYADYLAKKFSGFSKIKERAFVGHFSGEYGFVNKRLPVRKVSFDTKHQDTYYIETKTRRVASKVNQLDRWEGFSFAFLHKYHTLDFAGKNLRDIIMSLAAIGILSVSLLGFLLYLNPRN